MKEVVLDMRAEFEGLNFNSQRLVQRFIMTIETLFRQSSGSIWLCSANRAEAKAIYRMPGNEGLDRETHTKRPKG